MICPRRLKGKSNLITMPEKRLAQLLAQKDEQIARKDAALAQKDEQFAQKDAELAEKDEQIAQKNAELAEKDKEIAAKDARILDVAKSNWHDGLHRVVGCSWLDLR